MGIRQKVGALTAWLVEYGHCAARRMTGMHAGFAFARSERCLSTQVSPLQRYYRVPVQTLEMRDPEHKNQPRQPKSRVSSGRKTVSANYVRLRQWCSAYLTLRIGTGGLPCGGQAVWRRAVVRSALGNIPASRRSVATVVFGCACSTSVRDAATFFVHPELLAVAVETSSIRYVNLPTLAAQSPLRAAHSRFIQAKPDSASAISSIIPVHINLHIST